MAQKLEPVDRAKLSKGIRRAECVKISCRKSEGSTKASEKARGLGSALCQGSFVGLPVKDPCVDKNNIGSKSRLQPGLFQEVH